jgi:adenosylcobyric acid synthase
MLGQRIYDPDQVESTVTETAGLGLLPLETTFAGDKATHLAQAAILAGQGWLADVAGQTVSGYEIHMGRTTGQEPWLRINERSGEPVTVLDGEMGKTAVSGLLPARPIRQRQFPPRLAAQFRSSPQNAATQQDPFDHLADVIEAALDMEKLLAILGMD